jgi:hypothetical protein
MPLLAWACDGGGGRGSSAIDTEAGALRDDAAAGQDTAAATQPDGAAAVDVALDDVPLAPAPDAPEPDSTSAMDAGPRTDAMAPSLDAQPRLGACDGVARSLTIAVTAPVGGATVAAGAVSVVGTVSAARTNLGVTVNGFPAMVAGGRFAAQVVFAPGESAIVAVATDDCGATARAEVAVVVKSTVDGGSSAAFHIATNRTQGLAPLEVRFQTSQRYVGTSGAIAWDFDGNGTVDKITSAQDDRLTFRYAAAGIYVATATVVSDGGTPQTASVVVQVTDPADLDAVSRDLWNRFERAVRAGDTTQAASFVLSGERELCTALLTRLGASAALLFSGTETWKDLSLTSEGIAHYEVVVDHDNGVSLAYPRSFARDTDGLWRIGSF